MDPGYALAYAGLADGYYWCSSMVMPAAEAMPKARAAAKRALELDETLAEAHAALANVIAFYDWDWVAAEKKFQRAIELNPNYASAHHFYGTYLVANGRFEQAKIELNRAHQLDPLSLRIEVTGAFPYYYGRQYDEAIKKLRKTIEMEPNFYAPHLLLGMAYEQIGEFSKAIAEFETAVQFQSGNLYYLGHAYALAGMADEAREVLEKYKLRARRGGYSLALIYTGLGDKDQAFEGLEKAYEDRTEQLIFLKVDPYWDILRADPRFSALLAKMGFE